MCLCFSLNPNTNIYKRPLILVNLTVIFLFSSKVSVLVTSNYDSGIVKFCKIEKMWQFKIYFSNRILNLG